MIASRLRSALLSIALPIAALVACDSRSSLPQNQRVELNANTAPGVTPLTWSNGATPIHIRFGHTATLLGDARVLVAGGGAAPSTTELFDLATSTFSNGASLSAARTHHTATLLLSGKVLIAGGDGLSSAEIFDPAANTFSSIGNMSVARSGHTALRLRSGKVLLVGGVNSATDASAEIFDPATSTFTPTSSRNAKGLGSAALLANGKVLFVAETGTAPLTDIFDPASGTWTAAAQDPATTSIAVRNVVALRDGTALVTTSTFCPSTSVSENCNTFAQIFDPTPNAGLGAFGATQITMPALAGNSSVNMLPDGTVLFTGGNIPSTAAQIYDPVAQTFSLDATMMNAHGSGHSGTILPGGDVLIIGGQQAGIDVRVWTGSVRLSTATLANARAVASSIRLRDGRVLVVGGATQADGTDPTPVLPAEIYDPTIAAFTTTGSLHVGRSTPILALLDSGKALVAGGSLESSAEVFDPQTGLFTSVGSMSLARYGASAATLADGTVIIAGGCESGSTCAAGTSAEIFDPTTSTWAPPIAMMSPKSATAMTRLDDGRILVVGPSSADFFDPSTKTFSVAPAAGATRTPSSFTSLVGARTFLAGGSTLAAEIYDANANAWSFTNPLPSLPSSIGWSGTEDGRVLGIGGVTGLGTAQSEVVLFDSNATSVGAATVSSGQAALAQGFQTMSRADRGVIAIGGCTGGVCTDGINTATIWDDGAAASAIPTITNAPTSITGGETITITGSGFANSSEGTTGTSEGSPENSPLAYVLTEKEGRVLYGAVTQFSDTQITWTAPVTALTGYAYLHVVVAGVISHGTQIQLGTAPQAIACGQDAECTSGFCTDGFCCNARCDQNCQGCSAARKKSGTDGVCGAVPPGQDIKGLCFALQGQACADASQCATGFCTESVCCNAQCDGQCLSCTQTGTVGQCTAVEEGACDVACDGDHTLKKVGAPDVDCTPFKCDGKTCRTTCSAATDCVAPNVCTEENICAPGVNATPSDVSTWGCALAPPLSDRKSPLIYGGFAIALFALVLRKRRHARR